MLFIHLTILVNQLELKGPHILISLQFFQCCLNSSPIQILHFDQFMAFHLEFKYHQLES
jgi:hypothetical protein